MINKFELYLNGKWQDLTSSVQANGIQIQARTDEAFAIGTCQLRCPIKYNIAPYTPARINSSEYWLASSVCRKYLSKSDYYVHDVNLLELTAIMSCYIVGSKNFSVTGTHRLDFEKIEILLDLVKYNYGVNFELDFGYTRLNQAQEFTFGPGTTLYDAIIEISRSYSGVQPKVTKYNSDTETYTLSFIFATDGKLKELNQYKITNVEFSQNSETYASILESELTNVIDRTDVVHVSDISLRSDDVKMSTDNAYLQLPTRCESIIDFGISTQAGSLTLTINVFNEYHDKLLSAGFVTATNGVWTRTYKELNDIIYKDKTENLGGVSIVYEYHPLEEIVKQLEVDFGIDGEKVFNQYFFIKRESIYYTLWPAVGGSSIVGDMAKMKDFPVKWSLNNCILPKDKWELLDDSEKPKYCYYESGSNQIDGMNNYYKDDFWNTIVGNTVKPFLAYQKYAEEKKDVKLDDDCVYSSKYSFDGSEDYESINYTFYIDYYPIVDPLIRYRKTKTPINESALKNLSRSYDKSSNFIDYDRLINNMADNVNTNGNVEASIEVIGPNDLNVYDKVVYDNVEWFISSIVKTFLLKKIVTILNLTLECNKIADSIGVKTQYNAVKNPLNNIIDRPIYFNVEKLTIGEKESLWLCVQYGTDVNNLSNPLYKRAAILSHNNINYVVVEALDQFSFDKTAVQTKKASLYKCNDVAYVDNYNEGMYYQLSLGTMDKLTQNESFKLPLLDDTSKYHAKAFISGAKVYKDARERLIFCVEINNFKRMSAEQLVITLMSYVADFDGDANIYLNITNTNAICGINISYNFYRTDGSKVFDSDLTASLQAKKSISNLINFNNALTTDDIVSSKNIDLKLKIEGETDNINYEYEGLIEPIVLRLAQINIIHNSSIYSLNASLGMTWTQFCNLYPQYEIYGSNYIINRTNKFYFQVSSTSGQIGNTLSSTMTDDYILTIDDTHSIESLSDVTVSLEDIGNGDGRCQLYFDNAMNVVQVSVKYTIYDKFTNGNLLKIENSMTLYAGERSSVTFNLSDKITLEALNGGNGYMVVEWTTTPQSSVPVVGSYESKEEIAFPYGLLFVNCGNKVYSSKCFFSWTWNKLAEQSKYNSVITNTLDDLTIDTLYSHVISEKKNLYFAPTSISSPISVSYTPNSNGEININASQYRHYFTIGDVTMSYIYSAPTWSQYANSNSDIKDYASVYWYDGKVILDGDASVQSSALIVEGKSYTLLDAISNPKIDNVSFDSSGVSMRVYNNNPVLVNAKLYFDAVQGGALATAQIPANSSYSFENINYSKDASTIEAIVIFEIENYKSQISKTLIPPNDINTDKIKLTWRLGPIDAITGDRKKIVTITASEYFVNGTLYYSTSGGNPSIGSWTKSSFTLGAKESINVSSLVTDVDSQSVTYYFAVYNNLGEWTNVVSVSS